MKINRLETFLVNSGLRNYLFVRLHTDTELTGLGEASLEWQERTVETVIHEWVEERVLGRDPFDIEKMTDEMIRDQYQGGPTVLTAISAVEIAMWDIIGKECAQPVYKLLGGKSREQLWAYANGWYGGALRPKDFGELAKDVVARGYDALKFDPFGTAWKHLSCDELNNAESIVGAVRQAVGDKVEILIEGHGRLSVDSAVEVGLQLEKYRPYFFEEPVTPNSLELLKKVSLSLPYRVAAGERLCTLEDFFRFTKERAASILQPDLSHCGGLLIGKKIAGMALAGDIALSPHVSVGPVALCAAIHFGWSTPGVWRQENFSEYDVPWRNELVNGWDPVKNGGFLLPDKPGLGIE